MSDDATEPVVAAAGLRVLRLHLQGTTKPYEVDFRAATGEPQPLSVIAGRVSTGKSSILEFVRYGLGGSEHPTHEEVLAKVSACLLEVTIAGEVHVIRRTVGRPSSTAAVYVGSLEEVLAGEVPGTNRPIEPAGDGESLSSLLLSSVGLEGVDLREAPTQEDSETDPLSIRDLFWLVYLPNERLDDKNLLFESNRMKSIKLRQVVDVVFGVHDHRRAELGNRVSALETDLARRRTDLNSATRFVEEQEPRSEMHLELELQAAEDAVAAATAQVDEVEEAIREATSFAGQVRARHRAAARDANTAANELRDKRTLAQRLAPLRAQYAEDVRKLTMLAEAHSLFDPLHVLVCPACFSPLENGVEIDGKNCGLCGSVVADSRALNLGMAAAERLDPPPTEDRDIEAGDEGLSDATAEQIVAAHLRATRTRLRELDAYIESTTREIDGLRQAYDSAASQEAEAERLLDTATSETIAPFLAERDYRQRELQRCEDQADEIRRGLRLHRGLRDRQARVGRLDATLRDLREQLRSLDELGLARTTVVGSISRRFGEILEDFEYPKLDRPYISDRWEPHVREALYRNASSGARTLLSMAWILAIFETAYEGGNDHPGFLMIDSPQKNIGGSAGSDDEFADAAIVDGFYRHLERWLGGAGAGAQVLVVDNDPPASVDVIVRYTRDPDVPPYGLIDDEVTTRVSPPSDPAEPASS